MISESRVSILGLPSRYLKGLNQNARIRTFADFESFAWCKHMLFPVTLKLGLGSLDMIAMMLPNLNQILEWIGS